MDQAYLVSSEMLLDERVMRSTVIRWAVENYPALETGPIESSSSVDVWDEFTTPDEVLAEELLREACGAPRGCVEPSLMRRLIAQRRYGAALYRDVFGVEAEYWRGTPALDFVRARTLDCSASDLLVVLSHRPRLDIMLSLLSTHWSSRVAAVVCEEDLAGAEDKVVALLSEGMRRIELLSEGRVDVQLLTSHVSLREGFEAGVHLTD